MKYAIILSPEAIEDLRRLKAPIRSQVKEVHLQGEKMGSHLIIRFRCKTPGFEIGENPRGERFFSGCGVFFRLRRLCVHGSDRWGFSDSLFLASASFAGCSTDLQEALLPLHPLLHFPLQASYPAFDITSGTDQTTRVRCFCASGTHWARSGQQWQCVLHSKR
jgi:hypothetical protein